MLRRVARLIGVSIFLLVSPPGIAQQPAIESDERPLASQEFDGGFEETPKPSADETSSENDANRRKKVETTVKTRRSIKKKIDPNRQSGTGYGFYGGAELGVLLTSPWNELYKQLESTQIGGTFAAKMIGTLFTRRVVLDVGLGVQYGFYSGEKIGIVGDDLKVTKIKEKYSRKQIALLSDASARLKVKKDVQFGIFLAALYNRKSVGFPALDLDEDPYPEKHLVFLGPHLIFETRQKNYISRVGGSLSISLTGAQRTSYLLSLHTSLGSHPYAASTIIETQKETRIKQRTIREIIPVRTEAKDVIDNIIFVFDGQMINFTLDGTELSQRSVLFLGELAQIFISNRDSWDKIVVEGHTDSRGSANYNRRLSLQRAKSVAAELQKAGILGSDLTAIGMGSQKPFVKTEASEVDYAQNRRVEIKVTGLKDYRRLKKAIDEIKQKFANKTDTSSPQDVPDSEVTPAQEPVLDQKVVPNDSE